LPTRDARRWRTSRTPKPLQTPEQQEHSLDLPAQTANPRRTILMEIPVTAAAE
jgi:hypothetical protein